MKEFNLNVTNSCIDSCGNGPEINFEKSTVDIHKTARRMFYFLIKTMPGNAFDYLIENIVQWHKDFWRVENGHEWDGDKL